MELSVIIPTHNRSELLRRSLRGLCEQVASDRIAEVIVISDGSTDNTPAVIEAFSQRLPIRFIHQPKSGVATARNRGLREARGKIALLLDDDVVPSASLVLEHTNFHREFPELESGLLGYVTWLPELRITPFMRWYGEHALFLYALIEDGAEVDSGFLYTCNVSFKTEFLLANGGMNEALSIYEDRELGYRLAKKGMRLIYRRSALGFHNQTFTFKQSLDRMERYSKGFDAFFKTEAGLHMAECEVRIQKPIKQIAKNRLFRFLFRPLLPLLDSNLRLPDAVYWIFYGEYSKQPNYRAVLNALKQRSTLAAS